MATPEDRLRAEVEELRDELKEFKNLVHEIFTQFVEFDGNLLKDLEDGKVLEFPKSADRLMQVIETLLDAESKLVDTPKKE